MSSTRMISAFDGSCATVLTGATSVLWWREIESCISCYETRSIVIAAEWVNCCCKTLNLCPKETAVIDEVDDDDEGSHNFSQTLAAAKSRKKESVGKNTSIISSLMLTTNGFYTPSSFLWYGGNRLLATRWSPLWYLSSSRNPLCSAVNNSLVSEIGVSRF